MAPGQLEPHKPHRRLRGFLHRKRGAFAFELDRAALKDAAVVILPLLMIVAGAFYLASYYVRPAPPDVLVMSTGAEGGAYHLFGHRYRDILARDDVRLELRSSAGSVQNLARLTDSSTDVEAAFVQGGVAAPEQAAGLVSLGAIYYEPLWIFYRGDRDFEDLNELLGKRVAIGPEGSGTRALAFRLLKAVGADAATTTLEPLGANDAAEALIQGDIDAAVMVAGPDAQAVQRLVKAEGIRLFSVGNAEAFARHFPFLSVLTLPRGVFDLAAHRPPRDITLLAPTATIVVRENLHPALAYLLLNAATEVHSASGILQRHREFPAPRESEFRLSEDAERYFKSGQPFLRRYLPYWLANLVERMLVLLVPLFAVLVPAMKVLPGLLQWRAKTRVFRWYGEIRYLETELANDSRPERAAEILQRLDEIEQGVARTPVPRAYADYAYNLRLHIEVVRNRMLRVTHPQKPGEATGHAPWADASLDHDHGDATRRASRDAVRDR